MRKNLISRAIHVQKKEGLKSFSKKTLVYFEYEIRRNVQNVVVTIIWPFYKNRKIDNLNLFEQKYYSQNGEDGIITAIFNKIGTTNKFCVEFGVEDGLECNTRYLIEKRGW